MLLNCRTEFVGYFALFLEKAIGAEIRDLIPQLCGNWRSGLYTVGDAHGEPALSTHTIASAVREAEVANEAL